MNKSCIKHEVCDKIKNAKMKKRILLLLLLAALFVTAKYLAYSFELTKELKSEIEENQWLVKVHPNNPQYHFELAITYAYSNRIEDGLNELKKVDEIDKTFAPKALQIYSKKARLFPNDWKVRFRYAFALYFNNKKKDAIKEFEKIIKQDPKNVFSYGYIATIYGEMNKVDETIDYAKKALDIDSNVAAIHLLLGAAYYKKGRPGPGFQETFEALRLRALGY
jgi:tetratricopeptide (TPR) repeat protein